MQPGGSTASLLARRRLSTGGDATPRRMNHRRPVSPLLRGNARSHFAVNVSSNFVYVTLTAIAMLMYIPFLVKHLGVAAIGLISLAQMLVLYAASVADGLNTAVNRYLAIELNRGDDVAANRTFNSALCVSGLLAVLLLLIGGIITYYFPSIFEVPHGLETQSRILFGCVALHFVITIVDSNFAAPALIFHRFDLRNILRLLVMASRIGTVLLCFALLPASLWQVGLGFVVSGVLSLAGSWWLWRGLAPGLSIAWREVNQTRAEELIHFGGWSVLNRVGVVLFVSTDLVIINWSFGPTVTGYYGVLFLFPELIKNLMEAVTSILNPAIVGLYARSKIADLTKLTDRVLRVFAIGLALPIGLLCGLSGPLLATWLGPQFEHLQILLIVMVFHLTINLATMPLSYVLTSYAKVRVQALVTLCLSAVNFCLALAIARWTDWGAVGVVSCGVAMLTIRNLVFLSSYTAAVMGRPMWSFYAPLTGGGLATIAIGLCAYGLSHAWPTSGWVGLLAQGLIVALITAPLLYFYGLNRGDRLFLRRLLPLRIRQQLAAIDLSNGLSPLGVAR